MYEKKQNAHYSRSDTAAVDDAFALGPVFSASLTRAFSEIFVGISAVAGAASQQPRKSSPNNGQ